MTATLEQTEATERVGKFEFRIVTDDRELDAGEVDDLRARRTQAITNWLLAEWRREQAQGRKEAS
jgi:hypothetical protein